MKKIINLSLAVLLVCCFASSCKKDDKTDLNALINPGDANALSQVVVLPSGAARVNGEIPAASGSVQSPDINAVLTDIITSNGATAPFLYTYTNAINNLRGFYVQIEGANYYFNVPFTGSSTSSGDINFPLGLPANVDGGEFCLLFSVYDASGNVSNTTRVCADVLRLGTGSLQISLSWNTYTDQDLWVTDPSGTKIYYMNKTSSTNGQLDRDDTDGFGPENIFWLENAPDGEYKVQVDDYENSSSPNSCFVTVTAPGKSKSFTVTTQRGSTANVVTIRKTGTNYEF